MAAKKSQIVVRLEAEKAELSAYREAFFCLRSGCTPVEIASEDEERRIAVELLGPERASGGVVIEGASVSYASDWCMRAVASGNVYAREVAHRIHKAVEAAVKARIGASS